MTKARAATMSAGEARWAKEVGRLERSGLSIRTFAAREGLKAGTLSFWKWKLAQQRKGGRPAGERESVAPLRFVELTTKVAPSGAAGCGFEVVLPSGRTVRVPAGFDSAELARLVGVLEGAHP